MRFKFPIFLFFCVLFCNFYLDVRAQQIDELQDQIENAEKEIEKINLLLDSNRKQQIQSSERVKLLEKRLTIRQNLVKQTNNKIKSLESKLNNCDRSVLLNEAKIDSVKLFLGSVYSEMNRVSYSQDSISDNVALIALTQKCKNAISYLDSLIFLTGITRKDITNQKKELENLQIKRRKEVDQIISETEQLETLRYKLKSSESLMLSQIENQRSKINALQREIERIISIDNADKTSVDASISEKFLSKKGRLPSPLAGKGTVVSQYGTHPHPTIPGVKISNRGVNVAFNGDSEVYSIEDGVVNGVYSIAGMANTVLIRHGRYISVYANLSSVNVSKGDRIYSRQKIGVISSSDVNSNLFLHFELWQENQNLNPSEWIKF